MNEEKRIFALNQFRETMQGNVAKVTCRCKNKIPLRFAYRCYYCDEYYCEKCASEHFGKTREQYYTEKEKGGKI